jgi:hypothetical protein
LAFEIKERHMHRQKIREAGPLRLVAIEGSGSRYISRQPGKNPSCYGHDPGVL